MKTLAMIIVGVGIGTAVQVCAQGPGGPLTDDRRPPRGERRAEDMQPLTEAQQAQVKTILAKYNPDTLTADQAKAIHEAFRQTGLRGGPAMGDAIRAAGFDPEKLRDLAPPPNRPRGGEAGERPPQDGDEPGDRPARDSRPERTSGGGQSRYTLEQAVSDRAQLSTIAFSGLAFLTGDFGASTFVPPGKVCDYFGFQYMRDIDAAGKGHNPIFLNRVVGNVLRILNEQQVKIFADLAAEQAGQFEQLALKRLPLIKAFHREADGTIPEGSAGLNREAVMNYVGDIFAYDAELSYRRAEVFGQVAGSLTAAQKAEFAKMKFGDFNTWADLDEKSALKRPGPGASKFYNVAFMTYASEFFSWYTGSIEADVYFCPERHGTYFGGFYMKDMPAMGKRNYDISTAVTGDSGEAFLNLLNAGQRGCITSIIERQRKSLAEIVEVRRAISVEMRKLLADGQADKAKVLALGRRYGQLDGELSWMYATAFAKVNRTLTAEQRAAMKKLRNLEGYTSAPAYLYSTPMKTLPDIPGTDFFFAAPVGGNTPAPASSGAVAPVSSAGGFVLKSPAVPDGGQLPKEYTGDGESATLPLEWTGAPAGTKAFAVVMHHLDPEGKTKWYWILYNIPAGTTALARNVKDAGTLGNNSVNGRAEYAPPHSKGPGPKTYIYTVYALSAPVTVNVPPSEVSRDVLLAAMEGLMLSSAEMKVVATRSAAGLTAN